MTPSDLPRARVIKAHTPNPASAAVFIGPGDPLKIGEESPAYPGWLRATVPDGRSTWIPEAYVQVNGAKGIARVEYDSRELAVKGGEEVTLLLEYRGWVWVRTEDGREGWLPLDVLESAN